jgi:hypothetical protein
MEGKCDTFNYETAEKGFRNRAWVRYFGLSEKDPPGLDTTTGFGG